MSSEELGIDEREMSNESVDYENEIQFGLYLTNQYELLKRTLSFLPINDLYKAACVCRSWHKVVAYLLKKRQLHNKIRWHLQSTQSESDGVHCYKNNITFESQMILALQLTERKKPDTLLNEILCPTSDGAEVTVPGLKGPMFMINSDKLKVPVFTNNNTLKYSSRRNAALFLPKTEQFKILSTFFQADGNASDKINEWLSDPNHNNLKGLLVFSKGCNFDFLAHVYNTICKTPVPLAGGIFSNVKRFHQGKWCSEKNLLVLSFHGNIECYSDVLTCRRKSEIESFMKQMKDNVGAIDVKKEQRIAFVIRCVGRAYGKHEDALYEKYFPDTPAFVVVSYGECGCQADSRTENQVKRSRSSGNIFYSYSTMYFMVTMNIG